MRCRVVGRTRNGAAIATLLCLITLTARAATPADFERAEKIRVFDDRTLGGIVYPHWLSDGIRFTYLSRAAAEKPGTVYLVDPIAASKRVLFDANELGAALSKASGSQIDPMALSSWRLTGDERGLTITVSGKRYACALVSVTCELSIITTPTVPDWATRSPDGKWDAFVWNYNLYVRSATNDEGGEPAADDGDGNSHWGLVYDYYSFQPTGQRAGCDNPAPAGPIDATLPAYQAAPSGAIALTTDGTSLYNYGPRWKGGAEVSTLDADRYHPTKAAITWSPDSRKLVIRREDFRGVGVYPLYSSTSNQPVDHSYYYAAPGAEHIPQYDLYIADLASRSARKIDVPANSSVMRPDGEQWSRDSRRLLAVGGDRFLKAVTLYAIDPETGRVRTLIRETSNIYVRMSSTLSDTLVATDDATGDIFWYSERDGWGHLYRYGPDGTLRNQVDTGQNVFSQIVHVDSARKQLYFTAWGREAANP